MLILFNLNVDLDVYLNVNNNLKMIMSMFFVMVEKNNKNRNKINVLKNSFECKQFHQTSLLTIHIGFRIFETTFSIKNLFYNIFFINILYK